MTTNLITQEELNNIWRPSENMQPEKAEKAVQEAQTIRLYKILGKDFYNELITQTEADTVTAENQLIIDKSQKIIAYWAEYYLLDTVYANAYNKGHFTPSAEYGATSTQEVVKDQKRTASQKADFFTEILIDFLCDNSSDYPLYKPQEGQAKNLSSPGFLFSGKGLNREKNSILNKIKGNI